ncbi:hypothetical protein QOT17_017176 [Balamuthia mandrillaris]
MDREIDVPCTYFDSTVVNTQFDPPLVRLDDGDANGIWLVITGSMSLVLNYVPHPKL